MLRYSSVFFMISLLISSNSVCDGMDSGENTVVHSDFFSLDETSDGYDADTERSNNEELAIEYSLVDWYRRTSKLMFGEQRPRKRRERCYNMWSCIPISPFELDEETSYFLLDLLSNNEFRAFTTTRERKFIRMLCYLFLMKIHLNNTEIPLEISRKIGRCKICQFNFSYRLNS